jgi:hypothetical protein
MNIIKDNSQFNGVNIEDIERYAKDQFTQEEPDLNRNSNITKEQMQSFANQVLDHK